MGARARAVARGPMAAVFTWEGSSRRGPSSVGAQPSTRQLSLFETTFERNPDAGVSDPKPHADAFPVQTTLHAYLKMPFGAAEAAAARRRAAAAAASASRAETAARQVGGVR